MLYKNKKPLKHIPPSQNNRSNQLLCEGLERSIVSAQPSAVLLLEDFLQQHEGQLGYVPSWPPQQQHERLVGKPLASLVVSTTRVLVEKVVRDCGVNKDKAKLRNRKYAREHEGFAHGLSVSLYPTHCEVFCRDSEV